MHLAINHLGHFYLTYLLFEKLKKSSEMRIINVGAKLHEQSNFTIENMHLEKDYTANLAYSNSKLANNFFTSVLQ